MNIGPTNTLSSFGVMTEVENQLLKSENENKKVQKTVIESKTEDLKHKRQERIDNLQERIKMVGQGQSGCLKFLKIVTIVASAVMAPFTAGASMGLTAGTTAALQIATAALSAIGAIVGGLEQLQEALKQSKLTLNQAEGQQILAIITETKKWIEDEQNLLQEATQNQRESLEEYKFMLSELEESFSTMNNV